MKVEVNSERWLNPQRFSREVWRKVDVLPETYRVSNAGRVKCKVGGCFKILYATNNGRNYYTIPVKHKKFYIHRLVALAFVPNPNCYPEIDHINGIKDDNRAKNLRWVTRAMNMENEVTRKIRAGACKWVPVEQVNVLGVVTKRWDNITEAARAIGISKTALRNAVKDFGMIGGFRYRRTT